MTSLKTLKSVAHNVAHHFASTLSYWKDDYTINHLWNAAKKHKIDHVKIDVLNSKIEPEILHQGRVKEFLPSITEFYEHVKKSEGMSEANIESLTLEYDFSVNRISLYDLPTYDCKATIRTSSGREYAVHLTEENN